MRAGRTTYVVILGMILASAGCGVFGGRSGGDGGRPPARSHKLSAILIDSDCQDAKEQKVVVKANGKVDWYVVSECANYDQKLISIQFVDANGNEIPPPTPNGDCPKCSDKIKNNGFVKLTLNAKNVTSPETYQYVVWIGDATNPHQTKLSDPQFEIDP